MPDNANIDTQLRRLRRHYDIAVRTYDDVALLDLSHSLRIWTELKDQLPNAFDATMAFKTSIPAKKVLKAAADNDFIFCYMPGGVITYAARGQIATFPKFPADQDCTLAAAVKSGPDYLQLSHYCYSRKALTAPLIKALESETVSRCNYARWMASETVRMSFADIAPRRPPITISREMIIKRVANKLDGSHVLKPNTEKENRFDAPVQKLLQYQMGGLPLPYFILLKIAQEILQIAPVLLRK